MGYITKKGVDVRVARAVNRALAKERRLRPHAFTDYELAANDLLIFQEAFRVAQEELQKTHVVLTQEELASKLEAARREAVAQVEQNFPRMFTEVEFRAHDVAVRAERESELRTALDTELFAKCEEAGVAATEATIEAIKRMIATALSGCNFEVDPAFMSGLGFLAGSLLEQAQEHQPTSPQAKFGFHFVKCLLEAME